MGRWRVNWNELPWLYAQHFEFIFLIQNILPPPPLPLAFKEVCLLLLSNKGDEVPTFLYVPGTVNAAVLLTLSAAVERTKFVNFICRYLFEWNCNILLLEELPVEPMELRQHKLMKRLCCFVLQRCWERDMQSRNKPAINECTNSDECVLVMDTVVVIVVAAVLLLGTIHFLLVLVLSDCESASGVCALWVQGDDRIILWHSNDTVIFSLKKDQDPYLWIRMDLFDNNNMNFKYYC